MRTGDIRLSQSVPVAAASLVGLAVLLLRPLGGGEDRALALVLPAISLWATGLLPEAVTALALFTVAMLAKLAPAAVIFSGFQAAALWLIMGGLVMGVAIKSTGLGDRIARRLSRGFGDSYPGVIAGIVCVGTGLGFVMPSSLGRAVLLMPVALALADGYGFTPGRRGRTGVVMAAALGSHVATFAVLPANVPNMVFAGAAETLYGFVPTYAGYLLLNFPVLGLAKALVLIGLILLLWPDRPQPLPPSPVIPMRPGERWLALLLCAALALWATDSWHHISPAWISMAVAVLLLLPGIGLVDRAAFSSGVNFASLLYIAGILGLGALIAESGLGQRLGGLLSGLLPLAPNHAAGNFACLAVIGSLVAMLTTVTGVPAVLTPLAAGLAAASGLPLESVLMSEVLGFSNPILPYESPPLVVALQLGGEPMRPAITLCLLLAAATFVVLYPLDFLWWRWLGWI